jgi:hypothetical protein
MDADRKHPIVHLVGSIPLPDAETVFRTVTAAVGPHLVRLPDGETGIRKTWIRFLQDVLANNPAIELAADVPPFKFTQWDGKVVREIPRLRVKPGATPDAKSFKTGYADMAMESWSLFDRLQQAGLIPPKVKFQISIPAIAADHYVGGQDPLIEKEAISRAGVLDRSRERMLRGEAISNCKRTQPGRTSSFGHHAAVAYD